MADDNGLSLVELQSMKVADLKRELKNRGLSVSGNKCELTERLQEFLGLPKDSSGELSTELEGLENMEANDDVNEEDVLEDDSFSVEDAKQAGQEISEDEILEAPVLELPPESEKVVSKLKPILTRTSLSQLSASSLSEPQQQTSAPSSATTTKKTPLKRKLALETTETASNDNEKKPSEKNYISVSVKSMTDEERLAMRAKKFKLAASSENDRLKARAERFGVKAKASTPLSLSGSLKTGASVSDLERLKKRAERFGQNVSAVMKQIEEKERLVKRKSRFGSLVSTSDHTTEEQRKRRAERFGLA